MSLAANAVVNTPAQFTISNTDTSPDASAVQEIANAIGALNLQDGITFGPFNLQFVSGAFTNVWNSEDGDTPITFYQSNGAGGAFLPLGDVALIGQTLDPDPLPGQQLLFAPSPSDPSALQNPIGFSVVVSDHGSGNDRDVCYFAMTPPVGYTAVGLAFGLNPDLNNYWCVRSDLVRQVDSQYVWSDAGQGWDDDGDLWQAEINLETPPEPQMYFAPPTYVNGPAYALVMEQAELQVETLAPEMPTYDPTILPGAMTEFGLSSVKIVPCSAVPDPGYPNQSAYSPFYFVAAEPYLVCIAVLPTPGGGTLQVTETIGTSQTDSSTFTSNTSMSVSADLGVAYGPASLKLSASYTRSFGTTVVNSATHQTQVQTQVTLPLKAQPQTWIWELQTQIAVFRCDTSQLIPVTYSEPDVLFLP